MNADPAYDYIVILGREGDIAYQELAAVLACEHAGSLRRITDHVAFVQQYPFPISHLQESLGGVVKTAMVAQILPLPKNQAVIDEKAIELIDQFTATSARKIPFGIVVDRLDQKKTIAKQLVARVKESLRAQQKPARYILGSDTGLSSVQLDKNKVIKNGFELFIVAVEQKLYSEASNTLQLAARMRPKKNVPYGHFLRKYPAYNTPSARCGVVYFAFTTTHQDYKKWGLLDYGRPYADPKRGMLPPKLARMLVTLTVAKYLAKTSYQSTAFGPSERLSECVLLDPFCGEGTILAEGMLLGLTVYGSDIDGKAISETDANINWLQKTFPEAAKAPKPNLRKVPIQELASFVKPNTIDIIVTEPFLGEQVGKKRLADSELQRRKRHYSQLFTALLRSGFEVLKPDGLLTVVVPSMVQDGFSQLLLDKNLLDSCEKFGYTHWERVGAYAREKAKIAREIYILRKK